jgi:hypothetical protein
MREAKVNLRAVEWQKMKGNIGQKSMFISSRYQSVRIPGGYLLTWRLSGTGTSYSTYICYGYIVVEKLEENVILNQIKIVWHMNCFQIWWMAALSELPVFTAKRKVCICV